MEQKTMNIERSRSGLPCVWESGGGLSSTGFTTIVTNPDGYPKRTIYIRTTGTLCCSGHALVPIQTGDKIVEVSRHRNMVEVKISTIVGIEGDTATIERYHGPIYWDAVEAAVSKSFDYHCREPYYIKWPEYATTSTSDAGTNIENQED
jgi:hypothetical protein